MNFIEQDPIAVGASLIFTAALLVFSLGFLINWYRNRATIAAYKRLGFRAMLIVVGFELLTLALSANSLGFFMSAVPVILAVGWLMLRMWAFVNNGIFFSNKLGLRSFPLVAPRLGLPVPIEPVAPIEATTPVETAISPLAEPSLESASGLGAVSGEAGALGAAALTLPAVSFMPPLETPVPILDRQRYWLTTIGVSLGAVVYTLILFALTGPGIGIALRDLVSGGSRTVTPLMIVMFLEFAFTEELIFRLGIQNYLAAKLSQRRNGYWIAIVLTSIIWTLGHAGTLDPNWVKFVQIFPVGLILGWLYRRNGIESTIIAHSLFNLIGPFVISIR